MTFEHPTLIPVNDKEYYLTADYTYYWTEDSKSLVARPGRQYRITIPTGFITDIASVPRFIWTLCGILPDGLHRGAAVIHDYLYQWRGRPKSGVLEEYNESNGWRPSAKTFTRREVDKLFIRVMEDAGVPGFKKHTMYWAVRAFGKLAWDT